jgi:hypothetical protein
MNSSWLRVVVLPSLVWKRTVWSSIASRRLFEIAILWV